MSETREPTGCRRGQTRGMELDFERCYRAVDSRDQRFDGVFYTAVRTTGIFCRPSCPAKKPKSEHLEYFPTVRDALFAGYRACKRCRPLDPPGAPPEWLEDLLEKIEEDP